MKVSSISVTTANGKTVLSGRDLVAWCRKASTLTRACIAADWKAGRIDVRDLTVGQIARILKVHPHQISAVAALPADQRAALARGGKRRLIDITAKRMTDETLDKVVERVGLPRMWAAIDRATAPLKAAAE